LGAREAGGLEALRNIVVSSGGKRYYVAHNKEVVEQYRRLLPKDTPFRYDERWLIVGKTKLFCTQLVIDDFYDLNATSEHEEKSRDELLDSFLEWKDVILAKLPSGRGR
jgi:hypothetical protein